LIPVPPAGLPHGTKRGVWCLEAANRRGVRRPAIKELDLLAAARYNSAITPMKVRLLLASVAALYLASLALAAPAVEPPSKAPAGQWPAKVPPGKVPPVIITPGKFPPGKVPPAKVTADQVPAEKWPAMAEAGDPLAQALLARAFLYGTDGKDCNPKSADVWARRSARQNHPLGLFLRGCCRDHDYMRPKAQREEEAKPFFEKALAAGFVKQAEQGGRQWLSLLGDAHHYGFGMPQSSEEAVRWWRKAAALGDANAMFSLGDLMGHTMPVDHVAALQWFRKAAELGDANAMTSIGTWYYYGAGVKDDMSAAVEWWHKAADRGNIEGMSCLGHFYHWGPRMYRDECEAMKWLLKAAAVGCTDAMLRIGECYSDGLGVKTDKVEAARWYRKAAALGDWRAKQALVEMDRAK